jgi:hypothetical protein
MITKGHNTNIEDQELRERTVYLYKIISEHNLSTIFTSTNASSLLLWSWS